MRVSVSRKISFRTRCWDWIHRRISPPPASTTPGIYSSTHTRQEKPQHQRISATRLTRPPAQDRNLARRSMTRLQIQLEQVGTMASRLGTKPTSMAPHFKVLERPRYSSARTSTSVRTAQKTLCRLIQAQEMPRTMSDGWASTRLPLQTRSIHLPTEVWPPLAGTPRKMRQQATLIGYHSRSMIPHTRAM